MSQINLDYLYRQIQTALQHCQLAHNGVSVFYRRLSVCANKIMQTPNVDVILKMTRMSLLLEGFYLSLADGSSHKNCFLRIRIDRWSHHYGTPPISFLLTYAEQIEYTRQIFISREYDQSDKENPWDIQPRNGAVIDEKNSIYIDPEFLDQVKVPSENEKTGTFLKTYNDAGGYTITPCDMYSQEFIQYANLVSKSGGKLLEIGTGFGAATLEAIAQGATVFCNDCDSRNLGVVRNRYSNSTNSMDVTTSGDIEEKLILVPGKFPDELKGLPENFFDGIIICRVMHFFNGNKIEQSLADIFTLLKPGGKLFVVCETPYLRNWQSFLPEYERRLNANVRWPGEIVNPSQYESSGRISSLPSFVHWISRDILERSLIESKFSIDKLSYIDRVDQFPQDLLLDGRESVGAIASKLC